ncbi:sodium/hydrogen exchanger 6 [Tanacetum coccineum]
MPSECNNITLAIRNAKSEIVCAMCKQCLVTANHDVCVLKYLNKMNSRADNQSANASKRENQEKHKANVKKSKELGSKRSLASSRPSKPITCLSTSNPSEPSSKGFSNSASLLGRGSFVFYGSSWQYPKDRPTAVSQEVIRRLRLGYEPNAAMGEFKECVQAMEVSDVNCAGLHFLWNQKLKGSNGILKKIDRIMAIDKDPHNLNLREEHAYYLLAFKEASLDEERFLRPKSKIEWLKAGAFVLHYENFLGIEGASTPLRNQILFSHVLDRQKAESMVREVTDNEIKDVIFLMGDVTAPGPDGFTSDFFKKAWDVVSNDVTNAICDFFINGKLVKEINHTIISLVLKVSTPATINDYRHISCCNVLFKCISKIIANHIKGNLDDIVSINQSAFVPGRRISDNILLTQELMHNYHRRRGPPRCAFKVDNQKGYDTVDCVFVKFILIGKRGLSQGDPLSTYLFTMVMEILTLILQQRVSNSEVFQYHHLCEKQKIINLCFADDLFLFARGQPSSVDVIMQGLEEFKNVSGLVPSIPKSTSFFVMDCKILVEKLETRINDWRNKFLSIAGRLQLVRLVLSSMHIYWASVFIFPVYIIHDFEQLMRGSYGVKMDPDWLDRISGLSSIHVPNLIVDCDDVRLWRDSQGNLKPFSVACPWDSIRLRADVVDWLRQWDVSSSINLNLLKCPLCDVVPDLYSYMSFECSFFMQHNSRLFKNKASTVSQIVQVITSMVRLKLVTFKFKTVSTRSRLLLDQWKIPSYCMVHEGSSGQNVVEKDATSNNAKVIAPGIFKLDLEPLSPKEIVKHARALRPLDSDLDSACKIFERIQEVIVYVKATCPSLTKHSEKLVAITPLNKNKKVRFAKTVTSSSNTQKQVDSHKTQDSNKTVLPSTGMKSSTSASISQPSGNTKKNRISRTTSSNQQNKVEDHPRSVKSNSNKMNRVIEPVCNANVKHSMLNANSELVCATCNECMFDAIHDLCVLDFVNDVNIRSKSKSAKRRIFTIDGNTCPLTRITSTKVVPLKETTSKSVTTPNPKIKIYHRKTKVAKSNKICRLSNLFSGTVRFKNDQITKIMGYGDYQMGIVMISQVYYVESFKDIVLVMESMVISFELRLYHYTGQTRTGLRAAQIKVLEGSLMFRMCSREKQETLPQTQSQRLHSRKALFVAH